MLVEPIFCILVSRCSSASMSVQLYLNNKIVTACHAEALQDLDSCSIIARKLARVAASTKTEMSASTRAGALGLRSTTV